MARDVKPTKTLGRRKPKAAPEAPAPSKGTRSLGPRQKAEPPAAPLLAEADQALLAQLVERTREPAGELLGRALRAYAATLLPQLDARAAADAAAARAQLALGELQEEAYDGIPRRLYLSVDGKPELEVGHDEFLIGSGDGCHLRLHLPLIAPRHARLLFREGRYLFEDLRSPKGSYLHGQPVDVRFIEDGDEIDLGGFLPLRFKLRAAVV